MKIKLSLALVIGAGLLLAGCAKEGPVAEEKTGKKYVTITAGFENSNDKTRTYYDSSTGEVGWNTNDAIGLVCYYGDIEDGQCIADNLKYTVSGNGSSGIFTGEFEYLTEAEEASRGGVGLDYNFFAYYPYNPNYEAYSDEEPDYPTPMPIVIPMNKPYNAASSIMGLSEKDGLVASAVTSRDEALKFTFKRIPALLEFRITNQTGSTKIITSVDLQSYETLLSGSFGYDMYGDISENSGSNVLGVSVDEGTGRVLNTRTISIKMLLYPDANAPYFDEDINLTIEYTDTSGEIGGTYNQPIKLYRSNGEPFEQGGHYFKKITMQ